MIEPLLCASIYGKTARVNARAFQRDRITVVPLFGRRLLDIKPIAEVGGVVDEHVDSPGACGRQFGRPFDVGCRCHIRRCECSLTSALENLLGGGLTRFAIDIGEKHPGALIGKHLGDRPANAMCGAGHDRHFVLESGHALEATSSTLAPGSAGGCTALRCQIILFQNPRQSRGLLIQLSRQPYSTCQFASG